MAGSNQYGDWTDEEAKQVEFFRNNLDGPGGKLFGKTEGERAYAYERGYLTPPTTDPAVENAKKQSGLDENGFISAEYPGVDEDGFITAPYPTNKETFGDRSGEYPRKEYENTTSVNNSATGGVNTNYLNLAVSVPGVDLRKYSSGIVSKYTDVQVIETKSGHVIEYNDTAENPRILIKHATGSGIEMRPDGTIVMSSQGDGKVEVAHGGHTLIVTGDGKLNYGGDLTLDVAGDFNVNVGGSYNVQAKEETKTVNGPSRDLYVGNKYTSIVGSRQDVMTENHSSAALGSRDIYTKGDNRIVSEGGMTVASKGTLSMSSEERLTQAAPDINIAAQSISVFGNTGTIGGENVIMHNYNMYSGNSIWAGETVNTKTVTATKSVNALTMSAYFVGDLEGTAETSAGDSTFTTQSHAVDASFDITGQDNIPTEAALAEYLAKGGYGIQKIFIDKGNHLFDAYDKTNETGNVTKKILTTAETRARMRDTGHRANEKFSSGQSATGTISPRYLKTTPQGVSYVIDPSETVIGGRTGGVGGDTGVSVISNTNLTAPLSVDPAYDPAGATQIVSTTELARGITLTQFLRGRGDSGKLDPALTLPQKKQLVRNLIPQAQLVQAVRGNKDIFAGYNLQIVEGVYVKEPDETITEGGMLDLRSQGRAVVYEVIGPDGVIDVSKTVDVAVWMANNIRYDKIILDYDSYEPDFIVGEEELLNVQIIVIMPIIAPDFKFEASKPKESDDAGKVYVIGDSHAKAMGGTNNRASNGARLSAIAAQASGVPDGSTVYMTGGHNDVPGGMSAASIASQVKSIMDKLKARGCTVYYILFPQGSKNGNQSNMGPARKAISSAVSVSKDLEGCSMQRDGIHCELKHYYNIVDDTELTPAVGDKDPEGDKGGNGPKMQTETLYNNVSQGKEFVVLGSAIKDRPDGQDEDSKVQDEVEEADEPDDTQGPR